MDGPAYTKPPRDTQRSSVDKSFLEMIDDAKRMKGSLFETRKDKALRDAYQMAEDGPQAGTIGPLFKVAGRHLPGAFTRNEMKGQQATERYFPKTWKAMVRDPEEFVVRNNPQLPPRQFGVTEFPANAKGVYDRTRGPIDVQYGPMAGPETYAHEPLHGLLAARGKPKGVFPRGKEILSNRGATSDVADKLYRAGNMEGGVGHAAVSRVADSMAHRSNLAPTSTTSVDDLLYELQRRASSGPSNGPSRGGMHVGDR